MQGKHVGTASAVLTLLFGTDTNKIQNGYLRGKDKERLLLFLQEACCALTPPSTRPHIPRLPLRQKMVAFVFHVFSVLTSNNGTKFVWGFSQKAQGFA